MQSCLFLVVCFEGEMEKLGITNQGTGMISFRMITYKEFVRRAISILAVTETYQRQKENEFV